MMRENDFSPVGKAASILLLGFIALVAFANIIAGTVKQPYALGLTLMGFALFLVAKVSVIRTSAWVSFGTELMSPDMANLYRLGYWLMVVGVLVTFS